MRRGPADEGGVLSTFFINDGESVAAGDYDPRAAVVAWREMFTGEWEPLSGDEPEFALPDTLVEHLVTRDPARFHEVALGWAPLVDMDFHDAFAHLSELSNLARTAVSRAERLYCVVT